MPDIEIGKGLRQTKHAIDGLIPTRLALLSSARRPALSLVNKIQGRDYDGEEADFRIAAATY